MTAFKSDFLHEMEWRGFINQVSEPREDLDDLADRGQLTAYIGFDCTAPSLHVGSMVQIMCLHWLQKTGNRPIALMGGGTTRVGDPSGKDETRKILTVEDIERNKDGIRQVFARFLDFGGSPRSAIMDDNAVWLTQLNWIEMLREIGRHFSVNRMLAMDSVKLRLERNQEMSFIEFNYMLLQAYDFVELNKRYDCRLQMGGSDQWGNITQGTELGRRMGTPQLFALTTPLITTASGEKMGKTAGGAIWLNADMKSPYEYWQFWRNTEDADVGRFLKLFTTLPRDEIVRLEVLAGSEINEAKKILANEATTLLHGRHAAGEAAETAQRTFEQRGFADRLPSFTLSRDHLRAFQQPGLGVLFAFHAAGLVSSNGEARRQIKAGGLKVNDITVTDENMALTVHDLNSQGVIKLSLGKKRHVLLRPM